MKQSNSSSMQEVLIHAQDLCLFESQRSELVEPKVVQQTEQ